MAIVGSLFALAGRFAGRLLNAVLGWATLLLFGKVPDRRQGILLVVVLGSLLWVVTLVGVLLPDVGTFLLAFVPVPDFIDEGIVRLIMLALAAAIPLAIGVAAMHLTEADERPSGAHLAAGVLRGYPFTLVLALTIVILAGVAVARKVRSLSKRWEDAHVPILVKPGGYDEVLGRLERVLDEAGLDVEVTAAPAVVSMPPRLLQGVAGRTLGGLVPDRLMLLRGDELEVLVYPSDVAVSGTKIAMARARAAIASTLTDVPAYMTTTAEAQDTEDALRTVAGTSADADLATVRARIAAVRGLDPRIARLTIPFDEWETLYRERLQVERDLLAAETELTESRASVPDRAPTIVERAVTIGTVALIAADVSLLLANVLRLHFRRR